MSRNYFAIISFGCGSRFRHRDSAASLLRCFRSGCCADFFPPLLPIFLRKCLTAEGVLFIICQGGMHVIPCQTDCASGVSVSGRDGIVLVVSLSNPEGHLSECERARPALPLLPLRLPCPPACAAVWLLVSYASACLCFACLGRPSRGQCRQRREAIRLPILRLLYGATCRA